ncbi:MAG: mechanosensitive ion channel family protein [Gammaproteobacteria bacterium]|nr:mechanosensitive ion channel family protein [Gammaproteobacteria bacterium]
MDYLETFFGAHLWTLHVAATLFLTLIIHFITSRITLKLANKAKQKNVLYAEAFLQALYKPLALMIWLVGLATACMLSFPEQQEAWLFTYLAPIKNTGIVFALTWATIRFIRKVETLTIQNHKKHSKRNKEVDETMVHAIALLLIITVIVIGGMSIMQLFGLPISGLLAFGGIGGAGIAFASKDLLANFFGGLVVYMDKPFKVGHSIRSPDKNIEGTVEHIGWRVTRIRTFDKRALYVPNSFFLTISVENASRMLNRRIKTLVGVRYDDAAKINAISHDIKQMLLEHPDIDNKQPILVNLNELGASSLDILVDAFTQTIKRAEYIPIRHDVLMKALDIIASHGAECAFPTQTLLMNSDHK